MDCNFDDFVKMFRKHGLKQDEVFDICNAGPYATKGDYYDEDD